VYFIRTLANLLNIKNISEDIPLEFVEYFDKEKYVKSQLYLKATTNLSLVSSTFILIIQIVFIISGGFNYINEIAKFFGFGFIVTGLIFICILLLMIEIIKLPFSAYSIFIIEEKFGFNKMNLKTFIMDFLKSLFITIIIETIIFSIILWLFANTPKYAWLYAFIAIIIFELILNFIAPVFIMPLFNKYSPLKNDELKTSIEEYINKENFKIKGVFIMDSSKRSTKSNAFFTGFGKFRRIVLFDTLLQKYSIEELTNIIAHEIGHFKLRHLMKHIIFSFVSSGIMFFVFSLFINKIWLYKAFLMQTQPIYAGIIFFAFLYTPISILSSMILNYFLRKHEYEADAYAVITYKHPDAMLNALKKLSVDNLSNLYPHKFKVFLEYSHPTILERIKAINKFLVRLKNC
jgi:STE24 endopeptidase